MRKGRIISLNSGKPGIFQAAFWGYAGQIGALLIQTGGMVFLARLLTPSDFGTLGVLAVFFGVGTLLANAGLGQALLRQKEIAPDDWTTVFYFNLAVSLLCFALLFVAAPGIAAFYKKPELAMVARVCALTIPIHALGTTRTLLLTHQLRQRPLMWISCGTSLCAFAAAIFAAWKGLGIWALVIQQLVTAVVRSGCLWVWLPRIPGRHFSRLAFHRLFNFGYLIFGAGILNIIFDNLYALVIGKIYTFRDVGLCEKATRLGNLPSSGVGGVLGSILLPVLGKIQDQPAELKVQCRKLLVASTALVMLFSVVGTVGGEAIILLLLGRGWEGVIPLVRVVILSGLLLPLHLVNVQLMMAMNKPGWVLLSDVIKKWVVVLFIWLTYRHGVFAIVVGGLGISIVAGMINGYFGRLLIGYGFLAQVWDLFPVGAAGALAGGAAWGCMRLLADATLWVRVIPAIILSVAIYVPLMCAYYKINPRTLWNEKMRPALIH